MEYLLLTLFGIYVVAKVKPAKRVASASQSPRATRPVPPPPQPRTVINRSPPSEVSTPIAKPPNLPPDVDALYDQLATQVPGFGKVIGIADNFVNGLPVPDLVKSFLKNPLLGQFDAVKGLVNNIFGWGGSHHPSANQNPLPVMPPAGSFVRRDKVDTDSVYWFDGRARHNTVPRTVIDDMKLSVYTVQITALEAVAETFQVSSASDCKNSLTPGWMPIPPPPPVPPPPPSGTPETGIITKRNRD